MTSNDSDTEAAPARTNRPFSLVVVVIVVGVLVTGGLTWISAILYTNNEHRLLNLRARDVGAVLTEVLPSIQTPLASAAALADATGGDMTKFKRFVVPYVGAAGTHPFVSMSLWRSTDIGRGPIAVVGAPPALRGSDPRARTFFARSLKFPGLSVIGLLNPPVDRLGYGFSGPRTSGAFIAYGESRLPGNRYSAPQTNSSFNDLDYALFLGPTSRAANLLITSVRHLPLPGRTVTEKIPFGDTFLTITVSARRPLAGSFPHALPWGIAAVGLFLTLGASLLMLRLIRRRTQAEQLAARLEQVAAENQRLYAEQRGIAQTLQHALLPEALPQLPGLQSAARYEAGVEGVEVGGDWYDLIPLGEDKLLLVVGDVSGRGLRAATTMASLRYAIHAYAAEGDAPDAILTKLSKLVSVRTSGQLATVLCALVDVRARNVTVTTAGHLPPLLIGGDRAEFIKTDVGLPIGVDEAASYTSATVSAPSGATLLAFTDGLVERRGESIDVGLERLRARASTNHASLSELLTRILNELRDDGADDDTAIAGIRWMN
jgi:serine phosphatase RsbU (regulator of sigma subunit)